MRFLTYISFFCFLNLNAQVKDTSVYKLIEFVNPSQNTHLGAVKMILPQVAGGSIADALNHFSALFVKSYSPGMLASTSMRGMGAQHTAVLWNGINLQSCMNSNIDLNLLPSFFIDQAAILTGANVSASGTGALAGAIHLNNQVPTKNGAFGELQMGSFNKKSIGIGYALNVKKWTSNSRFLFNSNQNDFKYRNTFLPNQPFEKLQHAKVLQNGFMQEIAYKLNKKHLFYANYWYLETHRLLPAPLGVTAQNDEKQDDFSSKFILKHSFLPNADFTLISKAAFLDESINYYNLLLEPAFNQAKSFILNTDLSWHVNQQIQLLYDADFTKQIAFTDGYRLGKSRHLISMYSGLKWNNLNKKLILKAGNRQLLSNGNIMPSAPDFAAELSLSKQFKLKTNIAGTYRLPSFNDMYWSPGGNPLLKPEIGKKIEFSTLFKSDIINFAVTSFFHHVNDWILWAPNPMNNIWMANNAKTVQSKGLEFAFDQSVSFLKWHKLSCFGRYQFVESVNKNVYSGDSASINKQLFYTPIHTAFLQFQYLFKSTSIALGSVYTGSRFTTTNNDPDYVLPHFIVFNVSIATVVQIKNMKFNLIGQINNLTNNEYQVVENRPMPMRNFSLSLKFNINHE